MLPRYLLQIPSNQNEGVQPSRNRLDHPLWAILLQHNFLRVKNAGSTYQCMILTCLDNQISKTVEAYVDDMVIETRHVSQLVDDLPQTFHNLWAYDIRLNLDKCFFGVSTGKFLGFIVSHRGIVPIRLKSEPYPN